MLHTYSPQEGCEGLKRKKKHIPHEPVTLRLFFSLRVTPRLATEFSSVLSYALLRYG